MAKELPWVTQLIRFPLIRTYEFHWPKDMGLISSLFLIFCTYRLKVGQMIHKHENKQTRMRTNGASSRNKV